MEKQNCWNIKKCGREPGGSNADKFGICPAATDNSFDGLNSGENAGRICWATVGTLCNGDIKGHFAKSQRSCMGCEVFKRVRTEEGLRQFIIHPD